MSHPTADTQPGPPARVGKVVDLVSKLVIASGEEPEVVWLTDRSVHIGRAPENDIVLTGPNISRHHCRLDPLPGGGWQLADLQSTNGTWLNGEPVQRMALEPDDRILVGQLMLMYVEDDTAPWDALETSGVVFPWRPVRHSDVDTPVAGIPVYDAQPTEEQPFEPRLPTRSYDISQLPSQQRTRYLKELLPRLSRAGQRVASELDLGDLMATILAELVHWTECERAQLLLYDEDSGMLQPTLGHHLDYELLSEAERRFMDKMVKRTLDNKRPVQWMGLRQSRDPTAAAAGLPPQVDSGLCLPLTASVRLPARERRRKERQRRALGAIYLDATVATAELEEETLQLLEAVCAQAVAALQNAQLHYQATTDQMTRLYNRQFMWRLLTSEVHAARQESAGVGVILLDLDHLKEINDTYGHAVGDEVIIRVARRMRRTIRADDLAARWGGEEFLILLPDQPADGVVAVAEKVLRVIRERPITAEQIQVSASAGIALYPDDGQTADDLIRHADLALYRSKDGGRDRLTLYRSRMQG